MEQTIRQQIRILIVEDDPEWLRGLSAYLSKEPDLHIAATASSLEEARRILRGAEFDVVLMDIMLADNMEGIQLTAEITGSGTAKVIMLTSMEEKEMIFEAFKAGALDYHLKSEFQDIPHAIRSAYRNRAPISAAAADQLREEFRRLTAVEQEFRVKQIEDLLTPTEKHILEMVDEGLSQSEIADKLVVSIRTVKVHIGNILKKLGQPSSKTAARMLRGFGIFKRNK